MYGIHKFFIFVGKLTRQKTEAWFPEHMQCSARNETKFFTHENHRRSSLTNFLPPQKLLAI